MLRALEQLCDELLTLLSAPLCAQEVKSSPSLVDSPKLAPCVPAQECWLSPRAECPSSLPAQCPGSQHQSLASRGCQHCLSAGPQSHLIIS